MVTRLRQLDYTFARPKRNNSGRVSCLNTPLQFVYKLNLHSCKPKIFQIKQRNLNEKQFEFTVLKSEMLGLQAVQKSNGVCVHTKPPSQWRNAHRVGLGQ
jgi:hypothetical protein